MLLGVCGTTNSLPNTVSVQLEEDNPDDDYGDRKYETIKVLLGIVLPVYGTSSSNSSISNSISSSNQQYHPWFVIAITTAVSEIANLYPMTIWYERNSSGFDDTLEADIKSRSAMLGKPDTILTTANKSHLKLKSTCHSHQLKSIMDQHFNLVGGTVLKCGFNPINNSSRIIFLSIIFSKQSQVKHFKFNMINPYKI
ncbi:hypothetical protein ACTFIV_007737 [Dictyostelium citrinum]